MRPQELFRAGAFLFLCGALVPPSGCGGGSHATRTATRDRAVAVRVAWRGVSGTRVLPTATQSVVVQVQDATGFRDQRTLNRPDDGVSYGTAQFFALSDGPATIRAQAFANVNGTGSAVGEAGQDVTLSHGKADEVTLSFSALYTALSLAPATGTIPVTVLQGTTVQLVASGTLSDGTITEPNPVGMFSTGNAGIATVSSSGVVTGIAPGTTAITFADSAGRTASLSVTVRGGDAEVSIQ